VTLRVRITRRAALEIERADAWWRANRLAAPHAVRDDLRAALELLVLQPGIGQRVESARLQGVRRLQLDRVHHQVYFRVLGEELVVLAFWHSMREQGPRLRPQRRGDLLPGRPAPAAVTVEDSTRLGGRSLVPSNCSRPATPRWRSAITALESAAGRSTHRAVRRRRTTREGQPRRSATRRAGDRGRLHLAPPETGLFSERRPAARRRRRRAGRQPPAPARAPAADYFFSPPGTLPSTPLT
jgi:plasmid stabilization system protein ParE